MKEDTENLEEIATYGLEAIDPEEKIEVNLKDLMYVFATLLEYQKIFSSTATLSKARRCKAFSWLSRGQF